MTAAVGALVFAAVIATLLAAWWWQRDRARMRELRDGLHNRDRGDKT